MYCILYDVGKMGLFSRTLSMYHILCDDGQYWACFVGLFSCIVYSLMVGNIGPVF